MGNNDDMMVSVAAAQMQELSIDPSNYGHMGAAAASSNPFESKTKGSAAAFGAKKAPARGVKPAATGSKPSRFV